MPTAFERSVRVTVENQDFWKRFVEFAPIELDTAAITGAWNTARDGILEQLRSKLAAPLEKMQLSDGLRAMAADYEVLRQRVHDLSQRLQQDNQRIAVVKELAASADPQVLSRDLTRLKAIEARNAEPGLTLCQEYLDEKAAKIATEQERANARAALDNYRQNIFPAYQGSINEYLRRFNAGFRLAGVGSVNTRAGSACDYNVVINEVEVSPTAPKGPSFRNTLSAGDRNTLALAFFFASLDQDPNVAQKIVVIDDPMTSLDEHRSLTTVQEIVRLSARVAQVIVLSHSKAFLCALWENSDRALRSSAIVTRLGGGSTIELWDVNQDSITAHDRRYELTRGYLLAGNQANARGVAEALRPMLESFLRVAYPPHFPPGSLIGANFLPRCRQLVGTVDEIASQREIDELDDILGYANRFHHDSNPAYATEVINDQELTLFAGRTLRFMARR